MTSQIPVALPTASVSGRTSDDVPQSTTSTATPCKAAAKCGVSSSISLPFPSTTKGLTNDPAETAAAPPDGGLWAWLSVLGVSLVLASCMGVLSAQGVLQDFYKQSLFPHKSSSEIAWIGSAQLCLFFLGVAFASPHIHKDYSRGILASGSALSILSILFVPEAKTYGQVLVIQGIVGGLGAGTLFASALGIQCHWFDEKRALAVSIVAGGGSVGGVCGPILLKRLLANPDVGLENGVRAFVCVVLACLLVGNLLVRPGPTHIRHQQPSAPHEHSGLITSLLACISLGGWLLHCNVWFPSFYEQLYFPTTVGSSRAVTYALAFLHAASFFGWIIQSLFADHLAPFKVQAACLVNAATVLGLMHIMEVSDVLLALHAVLYGASGGAFIALVSSIAVRILSKDLLKSRLGQGSAFLLLVVGLGLVYNPAAGRLLALADVARHPIVFSGSVVLAGSLAMTVGTMRGGKRESHSRV